MAKRYFFLFIFNLFTLSACQTYTKENLLMREQMYSNHIAKASEILDKSSIVTEDRNYALFRMEKGMLLYLQQQYDPAVQLWILADKRLDNLYTTSISRSASSFIINDSMADYEGEAHERILLPIFSSIAFFANNNLNNAQVMVRRTYDVINSLKGSIKEESIINYDAFSHYFSALVYEAKNDWDSAIIEYQAALKNIKKLEINIAKDEILKPLARVAEFRNRNEILEPIKKMDPNLTWINQKKLMSKGEIYIIYECGKSPIKIAEDIIVPNGKTIAKISFPKYQKLNYASHYADIYMNKKLIQRTVIMEDVGKMAEQALMDRRVRDLAKMAARVIAKDTTAKKLTEENPFAGLAADVFNVVTEVADTRSWTTLPDTIQVARIVVEPNKEADIEIKPQAGESLRFSTILAPGEKKLFRLRTFN